MEVVSGGKNTKNEKKSSRKKKSSTTNLEEILIGNDDNDNDDDETTLRRHSLVPAATSTTAYQHSPRESSTMNTYESATRKIPSYSSICIFSNTIIPFWYFNFSCSGYFFE